MDIMLGHHWALLKSISLSKHYHCLTSLQPAIAYSLTYQAQPMSIGGLGLKDKTKPGAPDADTIFRIGSVSKVFAVSVCYRHFLSLDTVSLVHKSSSFTLMIPCRRWFCISCMIKAWSSRWMMTSLTIAQTSKCRLSTILLWDSSPPRYVHSDKCVALNSSL